MRTTAALLSTNNNGVSFSSMVRTPSNINRHSWTRDKVSGNVNKNATTRARIECERDVCEEELYRIRCALEDLLASMASGDYEKRRRHGFTNLSNPSGSMVAKMAHLKENTLGWTMPRCSPCCRRSRRRNERRWSNESLTDGYDVCSPVSSHEKYSEVRRTQRSRRHPQKQPRHNRSRRSGEPRIVDTDLDDHQVLPTGIRTETNLKQNLDDPACNSLILKILEAKALDCLCAGYSKQETEIQIERALTEINQRSGGIHSGSVSTSSSTMFESPSVSSTFTNEYIPSPHIVESQSLVSAQLEGSPISDLSRPSPTLNEKDKNPIKSVLKESEKENFLPKKSKVTIVADDSSGSNRSKKKKKPPSTKPKSRSKRSNSSGKASLRPGRSKKSSRPIAKQKGVKKIARKKKKSSSKSSIKSGKSKTRRRK